MTWTRFMDMHSGGGLKEAPYDIILIEAPEDEAKVIFYNRFGHNPERVSCTCCGEDYSISDNENLAELTAYDRNCGTEYFDVETGTIYGQLDWKDLDRDFSGGKSSLLYKGREVDSRYVEEADLGHMKYGATKKSCEDRYKTLADYLDLESVLVVNDSEIEDSQRRGTIPQQGFVWHD